MEAASILHLSIYLFISTVEPPITDPPKSGQPPDSGQSRCPRMTSIKQWPVC